MVNYLAPTLAERSAMGRHSRRRGLKDGFRLRKIQLHQYELHQRWDSLPTYFQMLASAHLVRQALCDIEKGSDRVVVLEGADVAVAYYAAFLLRRKPNVRIHVDVCDSVLLLTNTTRVGGRAGPVRKLLKTASARLVLALVGSVADSVSYISERDLQLDAPLIRKCPSRFVVRMPCTVQRKVPRDADGPFVIVGDWDYAPNLEMLSDVLVWMGAWGMERSERLRVVGPNLRQEIPDVRYTYMGWVDSLADAFAGTCCSIALISSGAGVKNKVADALAFGIPVAGTSEAFNGLTSSSGMLIIEEGMGPEHVRSWARSEDQFSEASRDDRATSIQPILEALGLDGKAQR